MSQASPSSDHPAPPPLRGLAALLSFAVPGSGQILQGVVSRNWQRLAKGVLFLAGIWGMFFYGMYLAKGQNVYLPHIAEDRPVKWFGKELPHFAGNLYTRLHYAGQFWAGLPAWPALWNYHFPEMAVLEQYYYSPGTPPRNAEILGEADLDLTGRLDKRDAQLNELQRDPNMGKLWDIAWVYTVIAGVLNILVIYDAWAGPVHLKHEPATGPAAQGGSP